MHPSLLENRFWRHHRGCAVCRRHVPAARKVRASVSRWLYCLLKNGRSYAGIVAAKLPFVPFSFVQCKLRNSGRLDLAVLTWQCLLAPMLLAWLCLLAPLPSSPLAAISLRNPLALTHGGLEGDDMSECGFIFVYILCSAMLRPVRWAEPCLSHRGHELIASLLVPAQSPVLTWLWLRTFASSWGKICVGQRPHCGQGQLLDSPPEVLWSVPTTLAGYFAPAWGRCLDLL